MLSFSHSCCGRWDTDNDSEGIISAGEEPYDALSFDQDSEVNGG